ncbi:putative F-box/LRR-repeat protein At4g15060 [Cannabis sativa]|uniref:putative F-box/LRR-repeat protein At4g15060 n=1 Tax=Cannabis sativa TaxID=3483 RepID=UPI0029CA69AD|nr:putative F-box/LRR-repeat protein At4g15060 [Cannabis sativa]
MAENDSSLRLAEKIQKMTLSSSSSSSSSDEEDHEDRISKLPDDLLVHILSFLPTVDAVSTSFLSNRWILIWYLVPNLSFSITTANYKSSKDQQKFCNYITRCLEQRERGMFFIGDSLVNSLKLQMDCYERSKDGHLDEWVAFAFENKVKELNLCLSEEEVGDDIYLYCIPMIETIHLTILELSMVLLDSGFSYSFPSLKSLSLTNVDFIDTSVVDEVLLGSPLLEKLSLIDCDIYIQDDRPYQLDIRSSSLKFLEIRFEKFHVLEVKQIKAINLESLELVGVSFDNLNLSVCKAIKNLSLICDWNIEEPSSLEYLISSLPLLENLTLGNWGKKNLDHIKISSQHLKSFNVNNYADAMTVIIEWAPQLASFYYTGDLHFRMSMVSSNSLNGTFEIAKYEDYNGDWFINMMNFLTSLNCSWNMVTLHVDRAKALIFPKNLKRMFENWKCTCRFPMVNWEHLRVFTECKGEEESELRDALMWIFPSLKTLSIGERRSC